MTRDRQDDGRDRAPDGNSRASVGARLAIIAKASRASAKRRANSTDAGASAPGATASASSSWRVGCVPRDHAEEGRFSALPIAIASMRGAWRTLMVSPTTGRFPRPRSTSATTAILGNANPVLGLDDLSQGVHFPATLPLTVDLGGSVSPSLAVLICCAVRRQVEEGSRFGMSIQVDGCRPAAIANRYVFSAFPARS